MTAVGCRRPKRESADAGAAAKAVTLDDVVAEHRAKVQPKIDGVLKIAASLPKPTTHDGVKVDHAPIRLLVGNTAKFAASGDAGSPAPNATMLDAEDLNGDLTTDGNVKYPQGENILLDCAAMLKKKPPVTSSFHPDSNPGEARRVLAQCESFVYLLVVRSHTVHPPEANATMHTFSAGHIEGDVLVFDIDNGKQLGGYKFSAKNASHLTLDENDPVPGLEKDLRAKLWEAVRDGLEKQAPGASVASVY